MKELQFLENELHLMLDNIARVRSYANDKSNSSMYNSAVVGELKHRAVALKQRLTLVQKINTRSVIKSD